MADQLGVNRTTIWRAIQAIRKVRPLEESDYAEDEEIRESLSWYDDTLESIMEEIETNEHQVGSAPPNQKVGYLNVRLGLLNQLRTVREDRRRFMLDIGLLTQVPAEFLVRGRGLASMSDEQLLTHIQDLNQKLAELGGTDESGGDRQG